MPTKKIRFTIEETFEIETDLYTSDQEAIQAIKQELEQGDLFPDTREYVGWDYSKVKIARD
jgi:hypothetical protein